MSSSSNLQTLDFHDPRRLSPACTRLLQRWQKDVCERVVEAWGVLLVHPVQFRLVAAEPVRFAEAIKALPDPGVGVIVHFGVDETPTLLTFSNSLLLRLLESMLGPAGEEWPESRELTSLEFTMTDVLFQTLIDGLSEGWPNQTPLPLRMIETCRPRRCRIFPSGTELVSVRWEITSGKRVEEAVWLLPREPLEELLDTDSPTGIGAGIDSHETRLTHIAEQLPVEVTVDLGSATLTMSEIAELHVGDLLILDQSMNRPLVVRIGNQPRWTGVPCRVAGQQALEIRSVLEG